MPARFAGWHVMIYNGGTFKDNIFERSTSLSSVMMTHSPQGIPYDHKYTPGSS
jgi:hypothetical protein